MDETIILPFCHITNEYEFLSAIWNDQNETFDTNKIRLHENKTFDPFASMEDSRPMNWNPTDCRYLTTDELATSVTPQENLSIVQLNVRSLKKNFEHFKTFLHTFKSLPQIVTLSETWLKEDEDKFYNLPNYKFLSLPRENKIGGGVGIYISDQIPYKIRTDFMSDLSDVCEYIAIEITCNLTNPIILISMYRAPNSDLIKFNQKFNKLLEKISLESHKKIIVAGDLNINLLKYDQHHNTEDFFNCLLSNNLLPTITRPTRITEFTSTLLDNIFINCFENLKHSYVIYDDISDHFPVLINIDFNLELTTAFTPDNRRAYKKENFSNFFNKLKSVNWHCYSNITNSSLNNSSDPDSAFNDFHSLFYQLFDSSFPLEAATSKPNKISSKRSQPWMTYSLIKSCRKKSRLQKIYKCFPNGVNKHKYNIYRKTLKSCLRLAEKNYYHTQFLNKANDMRITWKLLNSVINKNKDRIENINLLINGSNSRDPYKIVNAFNEFFVNIGPNLAAKIAPSNVNSVDFLPIASTDSIVLYPTDKCEITQIILQLKEKSSTGLDGIPMSVIKFATDFISAPLSNLINYSITNGKFPDLLKQAKVIPIFKVGDSQQVTNYRPISILNSFSKIFEKIMASRLTKFLNNQDFFYQNQFGFRPNHSTATALITFTDFITKSIDNNETPISIFIDLSKAFDTLDHSILLRKLEHFGIRGIALKLFKDYLTNRSQQVSYKNALSTSLIIKCGVPQGSILGPLLFLIYINDLHRSSNILKFILFADDTTILYSNKSLDKSFDTLNKEINKVNEWMKVNKLSLNIAKTNYIIFRKKINQTNMHQIFIDNSTINQVSSTTFLGVMINSELNWKDHISILAKKVARATGVIGRLKYKLSKKTLMLLYDTLILSQITYCNVIWASTYKTTLEKIHVLQKKSLRLVQRKKKHSFNLNNANMSVFVSANRLSVYDINKLQIAKFIYQALSKQSPSCFWTMFDPVVSVHSYNTRSDNNNNLFLKHAKTNIRKFSISVRGPTIWNAIPLPLREGNSISLFIKHLKLHILQQ